MAEIYFGNAWGYAASAAQVNAEALALTGAGCSAIDTSDPAAVGGRRLTFPAGRGAAFPMSDPGASYSVHFFGHIFIANSGAVVFALTNSAGTSAGLNIFNIGAFSGSMQIRWGSTVHYTVAKANQHYWRIDVVEHASEGIIRIYRGSDLLETVTNINTSRSYTVSRVHLGTLGGDGGEQIFTHVVVASENLGAGAVVEYFPVTSDEGPNEMTKSNGALDHYEHLDEVPNDSDTTYLRSEEPEERTSHKAAVSGLSGRSIHGAQLLAVSRLEEESDDRLALRLAGEEVVVGDIDDEQYIGRGGGWYSELPGSVPLSEASLSDAELQIEHLAPEEE
jgi:hypothetical protein